jgi:hypothetical protein
MTTNQVPALVQMLLMLPLQPQQAVRRFQPALENPAEISRARFSVS